MSGISQSVGEITGKMTEFAGYVSVKLEKDKNADRRIIKQSAA